MSQALRSLSSEEKHEDKATVSQGTTGIGKEDWRRTKKLRKKKKKTKHEEGEEEDFGVGLGITGTETLEANSVDKLFGSLLEKIDEQLQINEKAVEAEDLYGEGETEGEETEGGEIVATEAAIRVKTDLATVETNTGETYTTRRVNGTLQVKMKPQVRRSLVFSYHQLYCLNHAMNVLVLAGI